MQRLAKDLNVKDIRFEGEMSNLPIDDLSPSVVRDPNKCVLCRRCVSMCKNVQTVGAIDVTERGSVPPYQRPLTNLSVKYPA